MKDTILDPVGTGKTSAYGRIAVFIGKGQDKITMAPRIYTSPVPNLPIHEQSIFTRLLSQDSSTSIGGQAATNVAFVDAATGAKITRGQLRSLALTFGYALRNHPKINAKRGDTILLYSPNSLAWPVVVFGCT